MSEYTRLIGAEEVTRAGHNIASAAEQMQRAALQFDATADRLIAALDDHARRMEQLAEVANGD